MVNNKHPEVEDGLKAVAGIAEKFTSDETVPGQADVQEILDSHAQGIARLGDLRYVTHSDKEGQSGLLILIKSGQILDQIHLPPRSIDGHTLNHAGGLQRIGQFLVIPLEPMADGANVSRISFWDLAQPDVPTEISDIAIECRTHKAGSAGIANVGTGGEQRWYVATCDNGLVTIYKSNDFPTSPFVYQFEQKLTDTYESFCLLADRSGKLIALGFRSVLEVRDVVDILDVDLSACRLQLASQRHLISRGSRDVHFRWGAGLEIEEDGRLTVLATKRNFDSVLLAEGERERLVREGAEAALIDRRFHINLFEHPDKP